MNPPGYRQAIEAYIRVNARPPDKFSHQARLYCLATQLAGEQVYDDEVLHAAAWMHDLGVFIGHRPENPALLAGWDCVGYAMVQTPLLLESFGFPKEKISRVVEAIRTHQPLFNPTSFEGLVLRDADILEQLGAVAVLRTVSKVGRDTRFILFSDALDLLRKNLDELPARLNLDLARRLAVPRVQAMKTFLAAAEAEAQSVPW